MSVGCGRSRRLIGGEDRAERAERLLRHGLHRELQYATDDRRDVAHGVALVGHGVPCGPGRRLLQDQPEEYGCVERMHGRPALGAVAGVAGHPGAARGVGQRAGESALALVVHRARQAYGRAPDAARGQLQHRHNRAVATPDGSVGRQRISLGGDAARHDRRGRDRDERTVAVDELLAQGPKRGALLGDPCANAAGVLKSPLKAR